MAMIKGITVYLYEKSLAGYDDFNAPIFEEKKTAVDDVLIGQPDVDEIATSLDLCGKKIQYMLGIPKGDNHNWENCRVDFFGKSFRTVGFVIEGIEENVPLRWHKKIGVELYG